MKNNKKTQNKYKRRRIVFVVVLLLLLILLCLSLLNRNNITKIALDEISLNIGGESLDLSQVISAEPNAPVVGAGMIPIKWEDENWQITTADDPEWYDYENGEWANIMLSDGYYKSEPQPGISPNEQLAERNIGAQVPEDKLGTIFTWIPRLAYSETQVEFLQGTSILEYMWTTESCFNLEKYGVSRDDIGFTGMWVGQEEFSDVAELQNKITKMNAEENTQGLIANEAVTSLNNSEKVAVQKLQEKYNVTQNQTMLQDIENMQNRQVIKIINVNNKLPIMGAHEITEGNIVVTTKYAPKGIKYVADKDGNKISNATYPIDEEEIQYTFYIVDNIGNIRKYRVNYGAGKPYLKGFNKSNTFYVTYDEFGQEDSSVPIGETAPYDWYNYDLQQWANLVVRNNGSEAYYVWIPRYMYTLDSETETSDVRFVDLDNVWTNPETGQLIDLDGTEYKLPEAFTWEDPEDPSNIIQLTGFWASKYKLRDVDTYTPAIYGLGGTIAVDGVVAALEASGESYEYEMYLINSEGKRIVKGENGYIEGTTSIDLKADMNESGNYRFTGVAPGTYTVNIIVKQNELHVKAIANIVTVLEKTPVNEPDLTPYTNKDLTYYVKYNDSGEEDSSIPIGIGETQPTDWYDYDADLKATIVVRDDGTEKYYEWIPRYQYQTADPTRIMYIKTDKTEPDEGYTIAEEFITTDDEENTIHLDGYWKEKASYSNRLVATATASETEIRVSDIVCQTQKTAEEGTVDVTYKISLIQDGVRLKTEDLVNGEHIFNSEDGLEEGKTYAISIIALIDGVMDSAYSKQVTLTKIVVDKSGFNPSNTFYVTYNENGEEDSSVPIGEDEPNGWYDYTKQQWANIVVRNNGSEAYYTWIPRYQYKLDSENEKSSIQFISTEKITPDSGYQIPEAFMWEDESAENGVRQLPGFWASKYKLRDVDTYIPAIYGLGGAIAVDGIVATLEASGETYEYEMSLIDETGKRIIKDINLQENLNENGNYRFTGLDEGTYTVNIIVKQNEIHVRGIANIVTVFEQEQINPPNLSEFNENLTYYVEYTAVGEYSYEPLNGTKPNNWYDYIAEEYATVVVRDTGIENYYEWIPRYQCEIADNTRISYIPTSKTKPDTGFMIPEEFTTTNEAGETVALDGYWREKASYSNRIIASIASGENKIKVSNITLAETESAVQYEVHLIRNGEIKESVTVISGNSHVFDNITETGKYAVLVEQRNTLTGTVAGYAKEVRVEELVPPDVTGFRVDITYIVTYDSEGNADETQTLESVLEADAIIGEDKTLKSGKVDLTEIKGTWYDYTEQKWANIVVKNGDNGKVAYFTWIPRYEYKLDSTNELANVILIPTTQITADEGYQIPEAFTWEDSEAEDGVRQLPGFWASKYKLRD